MALRSFNGEVSYTDGKYLGNFKAALDGPAGAFSLTSPFSGDLTKIYLQQIQLEAGQGKAEGHLNLQFADGIAWDTALDLSAINPAYWVAELPGTLAGPLRSKGEMKNEKLSLTADLDLKGKLRGQPAVIQAKADGGGEQWNLSALQIRLGDNSINGKGSLQQKLAGQIDIKLPRLAQLWPQLRGQLNGRVDVAGTLKAPQGKLGLQGTQLAFEDNRLQSLNLDATLDSAQRAKIDLKGSGIQAGDTSLGTLTASGQGDIKNQKLSPRPARAEAETGARSRRHAGQGQLARASGQWRYPGRRSGLEAARSGEARTAGGRQNQFWRPLLDVRPGQPVR